MKAQRRVAHATFALILLLAACGGSAENGDGRMEADDGAGHGMADSASLSGSDNAPFLADSARTDYLAFAEGAVPVGIGGAGETMGPDGESLIQWIDGDPTPRSFITTEDPDVVTEFTYALPAPTTFDRFAVPEVAEVPSSYTTFTRRVEVLGSSVGPDEGFELLASGDLETHAERGLFTELEILASPAVRWVKLRLQGGIDTPEDRMSFEFSEIVGNGSQEPRPLAENFTGAWDSRFVKMELRQEGVLVSGCYDSGHELEGTVTGNILRARGESDAGIPSTFILTVLDDGALTGVRSTNGAPFTLYTGPSVEDVPRLDCGDAPPPTLGCGSVIHGINFDFDSAQIRPESEPILEELFAGLDADPSTAITIEGHTSSEGSEAYNQALSERRAQAVVEDLVRRGIAAGRLGASGKGEAEPIAPNSNENGRSLNRRVEVHCGE